MTVRGNKTHRVFPYEAHERSLQPKQMIYLRDRWPEDCMQIRLQQGEQGHPLLTRLIRQEYGYSQLALLHHNH